MVGLILFLTTASVWAGTFSDNFNDGNMDGWTPFTFFPGQVAKSTWRIENGELIFEAIDTPIGFFIGESTWKNYTMRVKAKMVKHQYDVVWAEGLFSFIRINPNSPFNLYIFGIGTTGNARPISEEKRAYATFGQEGSAAFHHFEFEPFEWQLDTWYDLRITAKEDFFQFYINGALVLEYTDATHPTGGVGISVCCMRGTTVHYDDFSLTGDDVPDTVTAVDPQAKLATTWGKLKTAP